MGLSISKETVDVPKSLAVLRFTSEAKYVDKKIRIHVEKLPSATDETEFKDALEEFIYILTEILRSVKTKEKLFSKSEFETYLVTYEKLQLAITKKEYPTDLIDALFGRQENIDKLKKVK